MLFIPFVALLITSTVAYNASDSLTVSTECLPTSCHDTWDAYGADITLPCSVASGHLPMDAIPLALPLFFEGNYDLCLTFRKAHFCRISSRTPVILPVLNRKLALAGALPLGMFEVDQCISEDCHPSTLFQGFTTQLRKEISRLLRLLHVSEEEKHKIDKEIAVLVDSISISCIGHDAKPGMDGIGVFTVVVFFFFLSIVLLCTALKAYFPSLSAAKLEITNYFSINYNVGRLLSSTPGDFNALNGVRFLSMAWVIMGHTTLMYAFPGKNPTAVASVLNSFTFAIIRGAEYAVDTFFLMSGLLASWGILTRFTSQTVRFKDYGMLILGRYLRLTPVYLMVILLVWKVMPYVGQGPNWSSIGTMGQGCDDRLIYNLLYVNNLFPWGDASTVSGCLGWSWYLANDFQFFLIAPLLVRSFQHGFFKLRKGYMSIFFKYGPPAALILMQVTITYLIMLQVNGSTDPEYMIRVYVTPYCRVTPYAVGVIMAFIHYERTEGLKHTHEAHEATILKKWKVWPIADAKVYMLLAVAIGVLATTVSVLYDLFKCPESDHQCTVWYAQFRYGFFGTANWGKQAQAFYFSFCYCFWSFPLAIFIYILFSDERYDLLGLKKILAHEIWTPIARLTYTAYLTHIPFMLIRMGLSKYAPVWEGFNVSLDVLAFIMLAYTAAFVLYMVIEKPIMNLVAVTMSQMQNKEDEENADIIPTANHVQHADNTALLLDRQFSSVSDLDSETVQMASPQHTSREAMDSTPLLASSTEEQRSC